MVRAAWSWARDPFWSALKMFHALIISPVPAIASLSAPQIPRVFDKHAPAAGAGPREARASIILSYRVQQYQTLRIGPGYWATIGSAVSSRIPSTADCATSRRSNRSLWIGGRLAIATACSPVIASSS